MTWLRWQKGRQGTGYDKLLLFRSRLLMCDAWLLSSGPGVAIPTHTDDVAGYRHYRANIILKRATTGGEFYASSWVLQLASTQSLPL